MNSEKTSSEKAGRTLVKDPVCNMDVDPATAAGSSEYKGQTYYFCSPGMREALQRRSGKISGAEAARRRTPKSQMVQIGGITPLKHAVTNRTAATITRKGNCHLRLPHGP